ncbi:unnamed protein product [Mytilus edulis]|uniref:Integrase p58-like C-terminal domain-containing protein n=1 Tax=Mytilus edulis TaxID=6550 RepID=A0A8S3S5M4_MYTED|nr:unnamed protein product [Mytilus edulis]
MPLDLLIGRPKEENNDGINYSTYAKRLQEKVESIHSFARRRIYKSSDLMKKCHDRNVNHISYEVGDAVWLYEPRRKVGFCPKLYRPWNGPFIITKKLNDVIYRIQKGPKNKPKVIHHNRLKRTPRHGACEAGDSNQILINKQTEETGLKIRDEYNKFKEEHVHQNIAVETRKGKTPPKNKIRPFVSSASRGRSPIRNTEHRGHSRSPIRRRREEPVPSVKSILTRLVSPARTSQTSNVPADQDTIIVLSQSPKAVATSGPPANTRARSDSSSSSSSSSEDS